MAEDTFNGDTPCPVNELAGFLYIHLPTRYHAGHERTGARRQGRRICRGGAQAACPGGRPGHGRAWAASPPGPSPRPARIGVRSLRPGSSRREYPDPGFRASARCPDPDLAKPGHPLAGLPISATLVLARIEPASRPVDDLVPVSGHPQLQPGVTRVLLRGRPNAGPVRAAVAPMRTGPGSACPRRTRARGGARAARGRDHACGQGAAQIRPADSVTEVMPPVSVTTARKPGNAVAVGPDAQVLRPLPAPGPTPGTARTGHGRAARQAAEGHPRRRASGPSIAESLPAIAPCRTCSVHLAGYRASVPRSITAVPDGDNRRTDGYRPAALQGSRAAAGMARDVRVAFRHGGPRRP